MKNAWLNSVLTTLLVCGASIAAATDNGGGPGGGSGGGFWCKLWCDIKHGSCEIPSGDPDVPPLKDPFCTQRKADCKAGCGGNSGGGGGILIGGNTQDASGDWLMSPLPQPACASGDVPEHAG